MIITSRKTSKKEIEVRMGIKAVKNKTKKNNYEDFESDLSDC